MASTADNKPTEVKADAAAERAYADAAGQTAKPVTTPVRRSPDRKVGARFLLRSLRFAQRWLKAPITMD